MDSVGEGKGGMIWGNGIEKCKLLYMKWIASPGSRHDTVCSGLVYWDDSEGWDGEGSGRWVQDGEHMGTPMADSCQCMPKPIQYCKVKKKKLYWNSQGLLRLDKCVLYRLAKDSRRFE